MLLAPLFVPLLIYGLLVRSLCFWTSILWFWYLLDPQTEVQDAVRRVAFPAGPADLPDKPGQGHVQLL